MRLSCEFVKMVYEKVVSDVKKLNISNKKIRNFRQMFHTFQTYLTFSDRGGKMYVRLTKTPQNKETAPQMQRRKE